MSTSVLVRGHCVSGKSRVPNNDATSSHRLHSIASQFIPPWRVSCNARELGFFFLLQEQGSENSKESEFGASLKSFLLNHLARPIARLELVRKGICNFFRIPVITHPLFSKETVGSLISTKRMPADRSQRINLKIAWGQPPFCGSSIRQFIVRSIMEPRLGGSTASALPSSILLDKSIHSDSKKCFVHKILPGQKTRIRRQAGRRTWVVAMGPFDGEWPVD